MAENSDKIKVLNCKASDNEYLHKDFHGALCYGIKYLDDVYGQDATAEYIKQVGCSVPLDAETEQCWPGNAVPHEIQPSDMA